MKKIQRELKRAHERLAEASVRAAEVMAQALDCGETETALKAAKMIFEELQPKKPSALIHLDQSRQFYAVAKKRSGFELQTGEEGPEPALREAQRKVLEADVVKVLPAPRAVRPNASASRVLSVLPRSVDGIEVLDPEIAIERCEIEPQRGHSPGPVKKVTW